MPRMRHRPSSTAVVSATEVERRLLPIHACQHAISVYWRYLTELNLGYHTCTTLGAKITHEWP